MIALRNKRAAVLGLMDAGIAAILFLQKQGAKVAGFGVATDLELDRARQRIKSSSIPLTTEDPPPRFLEEFELVILTPGWIRYKAEVEAARQRGTPTWSDLELACEFFKVPVIAVTGTNGKSTVMYLLKNLFAGGGKQALLAGGDYTDFGESIQAATGSDYILAELSSARLASTEKFHPHIAVLTNLYPGHAERHESFEAYGRAKGRIFAEQDAGDFLIHQYSEEILKVLAEVGCRAKTYAFSLRKNSNPNGAYYDPQNKTAVLVEAGQESARFSLEHWPLKGAHNKENLLAALCVAKLCGIPKDSTQKTIDSITPLQNRMETVQKIEGVAYVNDAKSSNVMATICSLAEFDNGKVVLIAGGEYMSQQFYRVLQEPLKQKVRCLIIFGHYRERFFKHWGEVTETYLVPTLEEAVQLASRKAGKGESVLFSPASRPERHVHRSSEKRGLAFKKAVQDIGKMSKTRRLYQPRA